MPRRYVVELTGTTPLLVRADNIEWADRMEAWAADKNNKKGSKAGDDRSPAWRWVGSLDHDGKQLIIPTDNIMRALMGGGAMVPVPGGRGGKTFKSQSQSGIMPTDIGWPLLVGGKPVPWAPIADLCAESDFGIHRERILAMGFSLFVKRARIGQAKHIRVRPRFDEWSATGDLVVTDDQITRDVLADILDSAGKYKGLGDWRPGGKTPGNFGMFTASIVDA